MQDYFSTVKVEISARHAHLSKEDFITLFGKEEMTKKKDLFQPGQFVCEEFVEVIGPKNSFGKFAIIGPFRKQSQVEISMTDSYTLGVEAVIRESGVLAGTPGCTLKGPAGTITLDHGVIVSKRHVHLTPETARDMQIADGEIVNVLLASDGRSTIFGDVVARVSASYLDAVHIDTDEANASGLSTLQRKQPGCELTGRIIRGFLA